MADRPRVGLHHADGRHEGDERYERCVRFTSMVLEAEIVKGMLGSLSMGAPRMRHLVSTAP